MATSPFGNFADLSRHQAAASAPVASPLESLIAGFTQGQAVRNLPETLQTQRQVQLEQELTRRLNNAILQQKLQDLQNPGAALAREVQKALALKSADITSGVVSMPTGLEGEVIAQPGALSPQQQVALEASGVVPVVAPVGTPITPIAVAGQPTGFGQDISGATAATEAIAGAKGSSALERMIMSNLFKEGQQANALTSKERIAADSLASKERIAAGKGGAKGVTETSKAAILGRAGKSGLITSDADLEKFRNDAGDIDYGRLALASGRAERESLESARDAKLNSVPAEIRGKVAAYQAVQKDLERLREKLDQEAQSGDIPSGMQDVISASLSEAPDGFFSRVFQRFFLQPAQSKTSAENERLRGAVSASISRAIAGAALTGTEKQNLIPFTPQAGDSFERLLEKSAALEQFLKNQIEGLSTPFPRGTSSTPASTPTATPKTADDYLNKFK